MPASVFDSLKYWPVQHRSALGCRRETGNGGLVFEDKLYILSGTARVIHKEASIFSMSRSTLGSEHAASFFID